MLKGDFSYRSSRPMPLQEDVGDREVWDSFLKGDKEAFGYIYETYVDDLFSYGMKVKPHRSLVKDSIQDLFVELWNRKSFLSFTDNIRFYLYRSLRRKICYAVERDKKLYNNIPVEDLAMRQISQPLEHKFIIRQTEEEKKKKVTDMLSKLSNRQQEVIRLLFFEKMSYEEVSEIMAINVRSVYTLTWKAISSIRKSLLLLVFYVPFIG